MPAPITLIVQYEVGGDPGTEEFRGDSFEEVYISASDWFDLAEQSAGFTVIRIGLTKYGDVAEIHGQRRDH